MLKTVLWNFWEVVRSSGDGAYCEEVRSLISPWKPILETCFLLCLSASWLLQIERLFSPTGPLNDCLPYPKNLRAEPGGHVLRALKLEARNKLFFPLKFIYISHLL